MRRRVSGDDFKQSGMVMNSLEEGGAWFVCDQYEIRGDAIVAKYPYDSAGGEERWRPYRPLEAAPDLFLKFARLYEESDFEGAVLAWSNKYGVPIGDPWGYLSRKDRVPLARFRQETKLAWVVLRMYEAALSSDAQAVRSLLSTYREDEELGPVLSKYHESDTVGIVRTSGVSLEEFAKQDLINFAFYTSIEMVNEKVREFCHQYLAPSFDVKGGVGAVPNPNDTKIRWKFSSLLGAMYLQMFWMIGAGGKLDRCRKCGDTISHAPPAPNTRKPRSDKLYCSAACRQAYKRSKDQASDTPF